MAKLEQDLTQGSVLKNLLSFGIPMFLANALTTLYSIVDTIIVGQLIGSEGISAVTTGSQFMFILCCLGMGFANGGQVVIRDKLWTFGLRAGAGVSFWSFKDDLKAQFGSSSEQVSFTSNPRLGFAASAFAERYFNRTGHGHLGVGVGYMQNGGSTEGTVQDESFTYDMRYDAFAVDVYYGMRPVKNGFYMRYGLRLQLPVGMKLRMGASPNLAGLIEGTDTDVALDTWYDVDKELRKSIVPAVNLTYGYTFGHADIGLQWAMAFASPHQEMGKSPWSLSLDFAYRF